MNPDDIPEHARKYFDQEDGAKALAQGALFHVYNKTSLSVERAEGGSYVVHMPELALRALTLRRSSRPSPLAVALLQAIRDADRNSRTGPTEEEVTLRRERWSEVFALAHELKMHLQSGGGPRVVEE